MHSVCGLWKIMEIPTGHTGPQCTASYPQCTGTAAIPQLIFRITIHPSQDSYQVSNPTDSDSLTTSWLGLCNSLYLSIHYVWHFPLMTDEDGAWGIPLKSKWPFDLRSRSPVFALCHQIKCVCRIVITSVTGTFSVWSLGGHESRDSSLDEFSL